MASAYQKYVEQARHIGPPEDATIEERRLLRMEREATLAALAKEHDRQIAAVEADYERRFTELRDAAHSGRKKS